MICGQSARREKVTECADRVEDTPSHAISSARRDGRKEDCVAASPRNPLVPLLSASLTSFNPPPGYGTQAWYKFNQRLYSCVG